MCLIIFDWQPAEKAILTLASNRDEFYARQSVSAHYWEDHPHIFGGRDSVMNGTWLAVSTKGQLAAVTNYRAPDNKEYETSRGEIPVDFLNSSMSGEEFVEQLKKKEYAGYNALLFDGKELVYTSNRSQTQTANRLSPGRYGLSNHLLDTSWPKVIKAKKDFSNALLESNREIKIQKMFSAMSSTEPARDDQLPVTGIPVEFERMVSPIFIESPSYGTRTTTLISVSQTNNQENELIEIYEREFQGQTERFDEKRYQIRTDP